MNPSQDPDDIWPALCAATRAEQRRVPFWLQGRSVGSVAEAHLDALAALARTAQPRQAAALQVGGRGVRLAHADPGAWLEPLNRALHGAGLVRAWRDEAFAIFDPATLQPLAVIERAAARFWGTLTLGAHATGYGRDAAGAISHLWIATRSPHKATDPGARDNLVGGGVPAGQSPLEALVREGHEEAGLGAEVMARAVPAPVLRLHRDIREGFQHEWLYAFDLELAPGVAPRNLDGEVASFALVPVDEAAAIATGPAAGPAAGTTEGPAEGPTEERASASAMTVDAALVTLDFLLRHRLLHPSAAQRRAIDALRVHPPSPAGRS